jgi:hypothetical protein
MSILPVVGAKKLVLRKTLSFVRSELTSIDIIYGIRLCLVQNIRYGTLVLLLVFLASRGIVKRSCANYY